MSDRSLKSKGRDREGREKRRRWPLDIDTRDPVQVAEFTLRLGYASDKVVNTLVQRCNLDLFTARQYVREAEQSLQGGSQ